jgi:DNA-binding GntR family transcriptional regulator
MRLYPPAAPPSRGRQKAPGAQAVVRSTLAQAVYDRLKARILSGELASGRALNENELALEFDVSPTPVREALNKLRGEGLVEWQPFIGTTVVQLTAADVRSLYDLRSALESLGARGAAPRVSAQDVARLRSLEDQAVTARQVADTATLHRLNQDLHDLIIGASANRWLMGMLGGVNDLLVLARSPLSTTHTGELAWQEHAAIVDALEARDEAGAEAAMRRHISRVRDDILEHIAAAGEGDPS